MSVYVPRTVQQPQASSCAVVHVLSLGLHLTGFDNNCCDRVDTMCCQCVDTDMRRRLAPEQAPWLQARRLALIPPCPETLTANQTVVLNGLALGRALAVEADIDKLVAYISVRAGKIESGLRAVVQAAQRKMWRSVISRWQWLQHWPVR